MKIRSRPDIPSSIICTWADTNPKPQQIMISRWSKSSYFKESIKTSMSFSCSRRSIAICRRMASIFSMDKLVKATTVIAWGNHLFSRVKSVAIMKMSWFAYVISCGWTVTAKTMTIARLTTTQIMILKWSIKTQKISTLTRKSKKVYFRQVKQACTLECKIFDYMNIWW